MSRLKLYGCYCRITKLPLIQFVNRGNERINEKIDENYISCSKFIRVFVVFSSQNERTEMVEPLVGDLRLVIEIHNAKKWRQESSFVCRRLPRMVFRRKNYGKSM